jgi:spermidine/putrescine ABC transporter ATP-binding subunit
VRDVSLAISPGEFLTLLGPSGSGKTTTLMAIAGFTDVVSGEILVGDRRIDHLPPHRRDIVVVFQHLALFPHMTVADNIAFPLRMRGMDADQIQRRVDSVIDLVRLAGYGQRLPSQLSGGQQQRVALARAIVFNPPTLLLDEPLGALDRKLRENMKEELRSLHRKLGITIVHVTHDQTEALSVSDRVAVMNNGRIEQVGRPEDLYENPANAFVADFVGESNFLAATILMVAGNQCTIATDSGLKVTVRVREDIRAGARVTLMIRPERVLIGTEASTAPNRLRGVVVDVTYTGDSKKLQVRVSDSETISAVTKNIPGSKAAMLDEAVVIGWRVEDARLFVDKPGAEGH